MESTPSSSGFYVIMDPFRSRLQVSHLRDLNMAKACDNNVRNWPIYPAYKQVNNISETCCRSTGVTVTAFNKMVIACGGSIFKRGNNTTDPYYENACYSWQGYDTSMVHFANMSSARSFGAAFVIDDESMALIGGQTHGSTGVQPNTFDVYTQGSGFQAINRSTDDLPQEMENPCLVTFRNQDDMFLIATSFMAEKTLFVQINRQTLKSQVLGSPPKNVGSYSCAGYHLQGLTSPSVILSSMHNTSRFFIQVYTPDTRRWTVLQEKPATKR